jgi:REP element-mobilizing transposase RayT
MTCTVVGWLPVFARPFAAEAVLDSWAFLQSSGRLTLLGYVVMENHLHFIAAAPDLVKQVQAFKSYTARRIIDGLNDRGEYGLLDSLRNLMLQHRATSEYQLWQEGQHPKEIADDATMAQKLGYVHNNPVKRGYVDEPHHWRYSSARNYEGKPGLIEVTTDWR